MSKGAESNFGEFAKRTEAEWEKRRDDFNMKYFHEAIALVIIYRAIDKMIPKQNWYEGGYKANIVAYTTSLLRYMINEKYPGEMLDLSKIWQKYRYYKWNSRYPESFLIFPVSHNDFQFF